jgi:CRISPR-associated protein Cas1
VLYLVNARILKARDFYWAGREDGGGCLLRDAARKIFLRFFEQKMATTLHHPLAGYLVEWRRAMDLQVEHMGQWIRGEVNQYKALEIR